MGLESRLNAFLADPAFGAQIANHRIDAPHAARFEPVPEYVDARLAAALRRIGIEQLYAHQRRAIDAALRGQDVALVTGTASGKTLGYNVPVLERRLRDPAATALYLFPTKALTQDQIANLDRLVEALGVDMRVGTYDGDTPPDARRALRDRGAIVATNPYMLHTGILPHHAKWVRFFRGLRTIVVDEMHGYTGVFGSHVANVLRRLLRVAAHYGARPTFVLCSATIGNPSDVARALTGRDVLVVDDDASARGSKHYLLVNPPIVQRSLGLRRNAIDEARRVIEHFAPHGVKTIAFAHGRNAVELLVRYLKEAWTRRGLDPERVRGYRGGYLPLLRRTIERELRDDVVDVVVSTNALELGIDLGALDLCVLAGYPPSRASFFQQAGRAGRRQSTSAVVLVARSLPLDQYVLEHPEQLFARAPEAAALDPDNFVIRANHLKCAAYEVPFKVGDGFGGTIDDTAEMLDYFATEARMLRKADERFLWAARACPADGVPLSSADADNVVLHDVEAGHVLAEIDRPSAQLMVHDGAIYQHQGETWQVVKFDWDGRRADLKKVDVDYYTEAQSEIDVTVLTIDREAELGEHCVARLCDVSVRRTVTMFQKLRFHTREDVGTGLVHLPSEELETVAFTLHLDETVAAACGLFDGGNAAAWAGIARLLRYVAPLFVRAAPSDLGIAAELKSPRFESPTLFLFDDVPGGVGLAETLFDRRAALLSAAADVVRRCACVGGCPGCIGPGFGAEDVKCVADRVLTHLSAAATRAGSPA
jgi:DEAD/DEAH box helicase domain-containing protein